MTGRWLDYVRIIALNFLAFCIMLSYSIARPATESLFLEAHTAEQLPIVWLLLAVAVTVTVAGFSRLLAKLELIKLFGLTAVGSAVLLALLLLGRLAHVPFMNYGLYLWKDIYIVLLVETFYSYTNAVYPIKRARWLYGVFGFVSTLGSFVGHTILTNTAELLGTANTLWMVMPIMVVIWIVCQPFSRHMGARRPEESATSKAMGFGEALKVIRRSSYLFLLVLLIAVIQISVNLVDYEFNRFMLDAFPVTDERTAMISQVYRAVDVATLVLHALTGPILRLAGVPLVLLAVPLFLALSVGAFLAVPRFLTVALMKVASKCFDYTIFRAAKEMLYIPLSYEEKTQGKSIIDVLTYRVAKGGASLVLLGFQRLALAALVTPMTLGLIAVWLGVTAIVARRFRQKVSRAEEMGKVGQRDSSAEESSSKDGSRAKDQSSS